MRQRVEGAVIHVGPFPSGSQIADNKLDRRQCGKSRGSITLLAEANRTTRVNQIAKVLCLPHQRGGLRLNEIKMSCYFDVLVKDPSLWVRVRRLREHRFPTSAVPRCCQRAWMYGFVFPQDPE